MGIIKYIQNYNSLGFESFKVKIQTFRCISKNVKKNNNYYILLLKELLVYLKIKRKRLLSLEVLSMI